MRRIRATLLGSTLLASMAVSGIAFAAPPSGGVPHADPAPAPAPSARSAPPAHAHAKAAHAGPGRERTIEMQRALTARNLYQGPVDGVWGAKTEAALRNFQTQSGLEPTGNLNAATAEKLGLQPDRQPVAGVDPATPAPAPRVVYKQGQGQSQVDEASTNVQLTALTTDQAKEMQQRLQLLGYYRGPIDGAVGEGTRTALRQFFQRQAELAQKGVVSNAAIGLFGTEPGAVQPVK